MVFTSKFLAASGLLLSLASLGASHPGEGHEKRLEEASNAHMVAALNARALEACNTRPDVKARKERAIARRQATFDQLRQKRGLKDGESFVTLLSRNPASRKGVLILSKNRAVCPPQR